MKTWRSEFVHNYKDAYSFGYCLYAQAETRDALADVYAQGYCPYSNAANVQDVFYMCRSLRVRLAGWQMNSENRRVYRLYDGTFTTETQPVTVLADNTALQAMFLRYFAEVHGPEVMPRARLLHVLKHGAARDVTLYRNANGQLVACVLNAGDETIDGYWFAAYVPEYYKKSLGMWLMIDGVVRAQAAGREFIYLGTAYGEKAKYKVDFNQLEWWAGNSWRHDAKNRAVKDLMKHDADKSVGHASRWQKKAEGFGGLTD
ncbi:MAG: GNAT family N-acetyltransferase [Pseudomonadaceae bacterium]|nr:GNAT family N-acetyltransferase [Pseudomonadaceae bacterium]